MCDSGRESARRSPPSEEVGVSSRQIGGKASPSKNIVPHLAGEGAAGQQVLHRFIFLVAEGTCGLMGQAMPRKTLCRPASILEGKPHQELNAKWCPRFPCEPPVWLLAGTKEKGLVARTGRVGA